MSQSLGSLLGLGLEEREIFIVFNGEVISGGRGSSEVREGDHGGIPDQLGGEIHRALNARVLEGRGGGGGGGRGGDEEEEEDQCREAMEQGFRGRSHPA